MRSYQLVLNWTIYIHEKVIYATPFIPCYSCSGAGVSSSGNASAAGQQVLGDCSSGTCSALMSATARRDMGLSSMHVCCEP